ncbi:putative palmitoyl-CoA hydrolase [Helianthus annuus]|nr:putative palmitoyl-CoA hydrolase [Helianthus annuus]
MVKFIQALAAASKTVHFHKILHSFHAHFLLPGDVNIPIIYQVDRLSDVPNIATRRVNALQKERVVFFLIASFHREEEGFDHQESTMPSVPDPETLLPEHGLEEGVKLPRHHPRLDFVSLTHFSAMHYSSEIIRSRMSFYSLRFGQFCDFRPKVSFFASGSKRFEILPFSSGSLTPTIFLR